MTATLSLTEAAVATGLEIKAVNKAIDNKVVLATRKRVPKRMRQVRLVPVRELICLQLEEELSPWFPLKVRKKIIRQIAVKRLISEFRPSESFAINISAVRQKLATGLRQLQLAKKMVVSDPDVLSGEPVIKGTRIPIRLIADMIDEGVSLAEILEGYPRLTEEQVALSRLYVQAFPPRGRPPKKRPWHDEQPKMTTRIALSDVA